MLRPTLAKRASNRHRDETAAEIARQLPLHAPLPPPWPWAEIADHPPGEAPGEDIEAEERLEPDWATNY